ncbi:ComEC/Rec2 family competence protein [Sphingomicrobium clamense]|uniref:ComEC/Rec2 family competence protein n=1 Tax=Sphingomicrobium clamense TaxID=2851013 RepID=A0ABS6V5V5_9SPHN|nr:ComEC/Rec2 family competence protein [Sphingomicrobium sp. B8]MBW0144940.1 ComEC/Rec2 family competence protein [Sphingomicrobium sp. B8]
MDFGGAPNTDAAASLPGSQPSRLRLLGRQIDDFIEAERAQLPLWAVVAFAAGIGCWFWLPRSDQWMAVIGMAGAVAAVGVASEGRRRQVLVWGGLLFALGTGWIWLRSESVAAPVIERVMVETFEGEVERVEPLVAKGRVRLTLAPSDAVLPPRLRVSLREAQMVEGIGEGAVVRIRARLMPPPGPALPGAYDFSRKAWFAGIGGVGTALGDVAVVRSSPGGSLDKVRAALGAHVRERLPGEGDGTATALVTGDKNAVAAERADQMRRSGLAHLLAVSGLHIAAVVGAAMLISLRLLALSERLALRTNLVIVSAGVGALAGIGYTLLTGMQVPTVRACIAALLVLGGLAIGREALSLRLVAVGALIILLVRPESLVGASFQLSFAAVTSIIALHAHPRVRQLIGPREEGTVSRFGRGLLALAITGLIVEVTLMPLALYHFHKAGLYGVIANLVAIPLTTFVIMPMLALALLFDLVGLGAPFWWVAGISLDLLMWVAETASGAKGAVAMVPTMPTWAFAACILGGLWVFLWRHRVRWLGIFPIVIGLLTAAVQSAPDLLITEDGRHLAVVEDGQPVMLRSRSGDFIRDMLSEASGYDGNPTALDDSRFARSNGDACVARIEREGDQLDLLAIRSRDFILWSELVAACEAADIVVADRRLPEACTPRWLKLDRAALEETGGIAISLGHKRQVDTVHAVRTDHPWR